MQQEQTVPRFDWPEVIRVVAIVSVGCLVYAIVVPLAGAIIGGTGDTGPTARNDIVLWLFRGLLWALIIWRGAAMGRVVGDRIVDDMLVAAGVASVVWLVIKVVVMVMIFGGGAPEGEAVPLIHVNDLLAIGAALLISWLGAKANRF
jgi:hypothetical protein